MRGREISLFGVLFWFFIFSSAYSSALNGSVQEDSFVQGKSSKVVDSATGMPINGAKVSIPSKGISALTDSQGNFKLDADINGPAILSVQKDGYRPFSLTVTGNSFGKPFILSIDKQAANQLVIDIELRHLGDDNYSSKSANASEFKAESAGSSFSKKFFLKDIKNSRKASVVIGSIIGLDTFMARQLHQNKLSFAYSSPAEIFVNEEKVGEIKVNGDNQEISFSPEILKPNADNRVTIKTGRNLNQLSYTDYDDMELMNLLLEVN